MSSDLIQVRRGSLVELPLLADGEQGYVQDEEELYIGTVSGNVKTTSKSEVKEMNMTLINHSQRISTNEQNITNLNTSLNNDSHFANTVQIGLNGKVDKVTGSSLMTDAEHNKLNNIENNANNYVHPSTHPANIIIEDSTHRFATDTEKASYADKYTKAETDNKISAVVTSLDYKEHVATFSDLSTTYPTPENGWTVSVDGDGITYKFNGSEWIPISANSIPLATTSVDGKMSKEDKIKLDNIVENSTKVEASVTNGNIKINNTETVVYTHPSGTNPHGTTKDDVGLGNVTNESKETMFANPTFTGIPNAPTAQNGTSNKQIATTEFVANAITGVVGGAVTSADKLTNARTIQLSGDVTGSVSFDGSDNVNINTTVSDDAKSLIKVGTDLATSTVTNIFFKLDS